MKKKVILGESDFCEYRREPNSYYVDKSLLINELIDNGDKVVLLPRPRRFGKTLNLSMLRYFFEKSEDNKQDCFEDLKIWQAGEEYLKYFLLCNKKFRLNFLLHRWHFIAGGAVFF